MPRYLQTHPTASSDPGELRLNADDYLALMRVAFNRRMYAQVAHMGHIAAELAVKAAYAKRFANLHPYGHELKFIADYEFTAGTGRTFFDELAADATVSAHYNAVKTAWRMQDRYLRRSIDKPTAIMYKTGFREVTTWILKNYV